MMMNLGIKIETEFGKKFRNSVPAYNENYLKTKIKTYKKLTQIFKVIKYQKKILTVFLCQ